MNTIIEKIRAEVNRLKPRIRKICGEEVKIPVEKVREKFDTLLSFLSDLEKEEKPIDKWSNKERKARVKKTGEIVCGFTDGQGHFDIPTDHNEFIRYNLDELEFDTLQEQPVDLEKEIDKIWKTCEPIDEGMGVEIANIHIEQFAYLARHFYELGQQSKDKLGGIARHILAIKDHLADMRLDDGEIELLKELGYPERKEQEQPVCEGLEEEIDKRWKEWISDDKEQVEGVLPKSEFAFYARHFAQWQKELMLKEAVEGYISATNEVSAVLALPKGDFKKGDKVNLLFVKKN